MNILSLFDGISCGRLACERAGIPITKYYASEIDKYAIQIAQKNYQGTVQLGDVRNITFPDWSEMWTLKGENKFIDLCENPIDLLLAGFPCQGFSSAGKRKNFEDERSQLFFEAVRILNETKPRFFLFENVASMSKESQKIITQHLHGVEPVIINSALVSAQHRKRLYWVGRRKEDGTYAQVQIPQPEDKGLFLKDILEKEVDPKYIVYNEKILSFILDQQNQKKKFILVSEGNDKALTQTARQFSSWKGTYILLSDGRIRRLTLTECECLQTLPDGYTAGVSDNQRYKMLGNAWTVDVIVEIFEAMKIKG